MTAPSVRVSADWLHLREAADAGARAADLVEQVSWSLPPGSPAVIHDLGCGTGSMGRWLASRLALPQHWVLYDRDPELLAVAAEAMPSTGVKGAPVSAETRQRDITRLTDDELAGASLITASALLDMLTAGELDRLITASWRVGCPVLLTLSVIGRVAITPADPLDERFGDAFNAHQRRTIDGRRLLGPDAAGAAVRAFERLGADVLVRQSPWRLVADAALATEWLDGWVGAACEQQPELTASAAGYARGRRADADAHRLTVTVHHQDILALPAGAHRHADPRRLGETHPGLPAVPDDRRPR